MRMFRALPIVVAGLMAVAGAGQASAALVGQSASTGIAALKEWNVVSFNNFTSYNHVDGRVFVGGNFNPGGNFTIQNNNIPSSSYGTPALTVVGNAALNGSVNAGGGISVGGNVSGTFNNNGQNTVTYGGSNNGAWANNTTFTGGGSNFTSTLQSQSNDIKASLTSLSQNLAALANTSGVTVGGDSNNQSITVTGSGLHVLNWSEAMFEGNNNQQLLVSLPNDATLVVNVAGTDIDFNRNFNRFNGDNRVLFNFYQATTVDIGRQFSGSVLGVFADITGGNSGNIDGTVIGNNVRQNANGEIHNNYFQGDLSSVSGPVSVAPEPSTWAMLILGFGLVGAMMRTRNRRTLIIQAA
ncbi:MULTISPECIES: choice-of-anchor A family protein [unclassified Sphingomonas]|uniref:choice-of-anchor A family protein n=1 Tax=unclassified Sphingomonas TaxID=196159 RepID=UPI0006F78667|nr:MULTISPECIES: choice-of-anchor A family protein [unclassified Sphingomonas]KQX21527.1 PEP-CTERM domain protein [Sphingomonas sp. Root1294]KQY72844.1 PEP-CTERM domain protein [Sphingomonas sp. Root50]KRB88362.1 PEP-CTERM domain protein [Sphingomonas sp. Root720]